MKPRIVAAIGASARYGLIPLLALVALGAWALSSPVGASPDEDYHLTSIWCGQGIEAGQCEPADAPANREIPASLLFGHKCFQFHPEASAQCQSRWFSPEPDRLVNTKGRGNFSGAYPPGFYFVMATFVGEDISQSVLVMRLFNAALFAGLTALLYWLLPPARRTMLVLGIAVTVVPLGMFILPSVNPSSWAVASGALVFPAVVGYLETAGRRRVALAVVATVATLMGAGARADAAVYAAFAVVLAVLVSARWREGQWKFLALPAVLCVICFLSYASSSQSEGFDQGPATGSLVDQMARNLLEVPQLWIGALGFWGLGWLDTTMPAIVWVINLAVLGATLYAGLRGGGRRKLVAVLAALAAAWLVPTLVLVQSARIVGDAVQPRYILPLLVLLAQVALFTTVRPGGAAERRGVGLSDVQLWSICAALTVTNAVALHVNMRRYVTGLDVFGLDLNDNVEWWWAMGVSPMVVWILGSSAFGAALFLFARTLRSGREDDREIVATEEFRSPYPVAHGAPGKAVAPSRTDGVTISSPGTPSV